MEVSLMNAEDTLAQGTIEKVTESGCVICPLTYSCYDGYEDYNDTDKMIVLWSSVKAIQIETS
jgi:hypothetical protein